MANNNGDNDGRRWAQIVTYCECQRNYATQRGRYAVDGCTEFLKAGDDGTPAAMVCATCGCHRNFHRLVEVPVRIEPGVDQILHQMAVAGLGNPRRIPVVAAGDPNQVVVPAPPAPAAAAIANEEENPGDGEVEEEPELRRRGRTRLTTAQKDAMRAYAERLGWTLQGHSEEELLHFCSEIGIIPQVFRAWMNNNRRR
ncbi:hypothetical protein U1Q18_003231 [Sarracenia purpurea var. burkii]